MAASIAAESACQRFVDPSTSVSRKVTAPLGSSDI